jgi:membrane protease YdiL (CAAX protease family)
MLAEKPWKLDAVARLFLGVMATFCVGVALAGLVGHFTSSWPKAQSDFWQIVVAASFLEIPALAWIALFLRQHNVRWQDAFGFRAIEPARAVAYGVLAGALFVPAAWGLNSLSGKLMDLLHLNAQDQEMVQELQDPGLTVSQKAFLGVVAIVVAPVVEELLFRGILYPALKQRGWPRLALWGSSALFALLHCNMASFVPLLIFAVVLVRLYETFENLLAPIVAHGLFNAANFFVLIFQEQISRALHLT